ncbi:MAG: glycosyl transferase, group 2 family protein, partial [Phycisphaerales bacterium]|nr:glycosyl transferase, group 2 family protein [Phycisphaerales bacterium]
MPGEIAVTVLMAVYNEARFAPAAVESILGQTFADFEFLIIDDGSTDSSAGYLRDLYDPRVRPLRNAGNLGLTRSLNKGLDAARGEYIARMDADDIALPDRLAGQVAFLDDNPHV